MERHAKYERLIGSRPGAAAGTVVGGAPLRRGVAGAAWRRRELGLIEPILVGPRGEDRGRGRQRPASTSGVPHRRAAHSHEAADKAVGAGPRRRGRGADEGQPAHRRADGRGGEPRGRPAHRAAHQPLLRHGRAEPPRAADHHRRGRQHRARRWRTRSTSSRTPSTSPMRSGCRRCAWRSSPPWRR